MQACGHLSEFKSVKSARKARFAVLNGAGLKGIVLYLKSEKVKENPKFQVGGDNKLQIQFASPYQDK